MEGFKFDNGILRKVHINSLDDIGDVLKEIREYVEKQENMIEQQAKIIEEWNRDEEILKIKNQIEEARKEYMEYNMFRLSREDKETIDKWTKEHVASKHKNKSAGVIGGRFTYEFTPTSIGTVIKVVCSCGDKLEIDDL